MHEYSKFLDMLNATKSNRSTEPVRRKKRDQQRDEKIKFFTNILKTDGDAYAGDFLLKMAEKNLSPQIGNHVFCFIRAPYPFWLHSVDSSGLCNSHFL